MLLKDNLTDIFFIFEVNFKGEGKDILKKLAKEERMINCNNFFFNHVIQLLEKEFGALHELLLDLLSENISKKEAAMEQDKLLDRIDEQKGFILLEGKIIKKEMTEGAIKKEKRQKHKKEKILEHKKSL